MIRSDKKLSRVLSLGLIVLICAMSLCAYAYAEKNVTSTATVDAKEPVVNEIVLTDVLIQSGANASQAEAIVKQAKIYVINTTAAADVAKDDLHVLLTEIKANETVTKMVEDYAAAQSEASEPVNSTSTN